MNRFLSVLSRIATVESRFTERQLISLIFVVGLVVRLALVFAAGSLDVEHTEGVNVARSLAERGSFADPFETAGTGPTAHVAPLHPLLLWILFRCLGNGLAFGVALRLLTAAASSLVYALLPALSRTYFGKRGPGVWVGLVGALLPFRLWLETHGTHEVAYAASFLCLIYLATGRLLVKGGPSLPFCALYGLSWGFGMLITPAFAPIFLSVVIWWLARQVPRAPKFPHALVMVLFCAMAVAPWIARNYLVLGLPSFVRDNFGLELAVSNNDDAQVLMESQYASGKFVHPFVSRTEGQLMHSLGETEYYRLKGRIARHWILTHPRQFIDLTIRRVGALWFTGTNSAVKTVFFCGTVVLGVIGLVIRFREDPRVGMLFALLWIIFPLPYYIVQISPRYRMPIDWSLLLFSGYAIARLCSTVKIGSPSPQHEWALRRP